MKFTFLVRHESCSLELQHTGLSNILYTYVHDIPTLYSLLPATKGTAAAPCNRTPW